MLGRTELSRLSNFRIDVPVTSELLRLYYLRMNIVNCVPSPLRPCQNNRQLFSSFSL
jgi:hypothetical protein